MFWLYNNCVCLHEQTWQVMSWPPFKWRLVFVTTKSSGFTLSNVVTRSAVLTAFSPVTPTPSPPLPDMGLLIWNNKRALFVGLWCTNVNESVVCRISNSQQFLVPKMWAFRSQTAETEVVKCLWLFPDLLSHFGFYLTGGRFGCRRMKRETQRAVHVCAIWHLLPVPFPSLSYSDLNPKF